MAVAVEVIDSSVYHIGRGQRHNVLTASLGGVGLRSTTGDLL